MRRDQLRIVYVSYTGVSEPLGRSQVLGYLVRLADSCKVTLISFEKDNAARVETAETLRRAAISWIPHAYHRRLAVISTLWDVFVGARALRRACRDTSPDIVHVRSYVPALIALLAAWPGKRRWKLLFDIRGFWADERVLAGAWSGRSLLYRAVKRLERRFFAEADGVVTLTEASVPHIRRFAAPREPPICVIPTCAEVTRFGVAKQRKEGPCAVWCGSIGTVYHFGLAIRFVDVLDIPFIVLTQQVEVAKAQLGHRDADVREVPHEQIASELHAGDIGLCFYRAGHLANVARAPTRIAEYLAAGMTVAISPGIGDLDMIVHDHGLGVCVEDESDAGLRSAATKALSIASAGAVRARGRRFAAERYSVEDGAAAYLSLYRQMKLGGAAPDDGVGQIAAA